MAKRLIKIAKELNVGTTTIVEHLTNNGFEIENKPTANVTDEMYAELLKEFQKSIAIKEKADQLVIGNRPTSAPAPPKEKKKDILPPPPPTREEVSRTQPEKTGSEPQGKEPGASPENGKERHAEEPSRPQAKLKVLGKIDLESRMRPKTKEAQPEEETQARPEAKKESPTPEPKPELKPEPKPEPQAEKAPEPKKEKAPEPETGKEEQAKAPVEKPEPEPPKQPQQKTEPPAEKREEPKEEARPETPKPKAEEPAQPVKEEAEANKAKPVPDKNELVRAEAPELRGLKILGKIDTDKLERPKRKKKKDNKKEPAKSDDKKKKAATAPSSDQDKDKQPRKKRRRTRKKVSPPSGGGGGGGGGARGPAPSAGKGRRTRGRKEDDVKEVSQKEIEEKIKATMARISGGGKKKRQKMRRDNRERLRERQEQREQELQTENLQLTEFVSVQELANIMDVPVTDVITTCMNLGVMVSINQRLDAEIIELVAEEFGHEVDFISAEEHVEEEEEIVDDPADLKHRAPIVTVMGHVDHGKTSLLDYIRKASVVEGEAGGITQHIGAYEVIVGKEDRGITFLDTPGHEAFTAMRARGAKVTDIAVIIIAADDNIMPQTKEAISHAQAASVPMVFAINKVDKADANPDRIKQELASMNFLIEEWGGKYQSQDISAKTGQGVEELLEKILLEAEMLELQANPDREAIGTILEASLDKGRGYVAKGLVQTGTLHIGDPVVAGEHSGKVKAMFNERGKRVKEAGPSTPILILGLSGAPQAGERFKITENEQEARQIASKRAQIAREQANRATKRISLDEIGRRLALGNFKELNLIVKGDVDGSVEALSDSLIKQSIESIQVNVIHKAVGQIVESDVLLASASDAIIIGFQVRPSLGARKLAEREGVQIKMYSIIYEAIDEVRAAIEGMLEPTKEEKIVGQVEVREVYKISKVGTVAGCYVQEGKLTRNTHVRLIRNGIVVYPAKEGQIAEIASLKRFKEDVREVKAGLECGISIKNFNDIKVGDIIEGYEIIEIKQTLD
ncbi:MAG: translation initiation factor IF-2 [Lewinellaceae bacterium]|nr:translation initiation factor IF-2 [Phaeodactylibacter sp.]MCB9037668.1 translation initiation factor IF-2 [Lewinellaceae bacterium]